MAKNKKLILLISHKMDFSGAPLTLFSVAKILSHQYKVDVWTLEKGPLEGKFVKELNIIPKVIKNISSKNKFSYALNMSRYSLVFINTVVNYSFAKTCETFKIPYVWYIHEAKTIPMLVNKNKIKKALKQCKSNIYVVSEYAKEFLQEEFKISVKVLNAFVEDEYRNNKLSLTEKIVFTFVGAL